MQVISFVAVFAVLVAVVAAAPKPDEKYTTKYDSVNIKEILENERLLTGYLKCLKGKGSCTPDGAELKSKLIHFPSLYIYIITIFTIYKYNRKYIPCKRWHSFK